YDYYTTTPDLHSFPTRRSSDLQSDVPGFAFSTAIESAAWSWTTMLKHRQKATALITRWKHDLATFVSDLPAAGINDTAETGWRLDRKSTRLNSSHLVISYAVFC